MAAISTHLHVKPFQVAVSLDRSLEFRKWDHLGTKWSPTAPSAAYEAVRDGTVVATYPGFTPYSAIYEFSTGVFVHVH